MLRNGDESLANLIMEHVVYVCIQLVCGIMNCHAVNLIMLNFSPPPLDTISLESNDIPSFGKKTSQFIEQEEQDIIAAAGVMKFEALQCVHNPTACDHTLTLPKMDKKKLCSVPYDRIEELVGECLLLLLPMAMQNNFHKF